MMRCSDSIPRSRPPAPSRGRLGNHLVAWRIPRPERQNASLRRAISLLAAVTPRFGSTPGIVPEQPFDRHLLVLSQLYRKSRTLFLSHGGTFKPGLVSSPRSLSSPTLLDSEIHYSPVESELIWTATDAREAKDPKRCQERILQLRGFIATLYHEQNHRTLWHLLPPAPLDRAGVRRYLNFAESLVITLDMALGDELGPRISSLFYLLGVTYDPGTEMRALKLSRRVYRNYLQAALHATYLNLELFEPADIGAGIRALFPGLGELAERAARRAGNLDRAFVWKTNPAWQKRHWRRVAGSLSRSQKTRATSAKEALVLPADPLDHRLQYLIAERCFETFGL